MTIASQPVRQTYVCAGVTGPYDFSSRFLAAEDLAVTRITAAGARSRLSLEAGDYTVSGAGDPAGGFVETATAYADGQIEIWLDVAITQDTAYTAGDAFPAEAHEAALDKLTLIAAQLDREQADYQAANDARVAAVEDRVSQVEAGGAGGGGGGGGNASGYLYAYNPSDIPNSLFAQPVVAGLPYTVTFGDEFKQPGSGATWIPLNATAYPPGGTFSWSQDDAYGHIRDGVHARFYLAHNGAQALDIRAALVRCDATHTGSPLYQCNGGSTGQVALIHSLIAWACRDNFPLCGGGKLRLAKGEHLVVQPVNTQRAAPSLRWGDMAIMLDPGYEGWAVTAPQNMHDTEPFDFDLWFWGDNGAFAQPSRAKGLRYSNDGGALQHGRVRGAYLDHLFQAYGNCEDHTVHLEAEYCRWVATAMDRTNVTGYIDDGSGAAGNILHVTAIVGPDGVETGQTLSHDDLTGTLTVTGQLTDAAGKVPSDPAFVGGGVGTYGFSGPAQLLATSGAPVTIACKVAGGGSPDDMDIHIQAHNCMHAWWTPDGCDSFIRKHYNTQASRAADDGVAFITSNVGKHDVHTGIVRGHNGPAPLISAFKDHGVSSVHFDLVVEHGYELIDLRWVARATGQITIRDFSDTNAASGNKSVVFLGRIANSGGLRLNVIASGVTGGSTSSVVVGDDVYFPIDTDLPELNVQRGSPEPFVSSYPGVSGVALKLYKARNCTMRVLQCDGDVETAAPLGVFSLVMPATWLKAKSGAYQFVVGHTPPNLQVSFRGGVYSDDVMDRPWLFSGVTVEEMADFDGAPFRYHLGFWDPTGSVRLPAVALASRTHRANASMGGEGVALWDSTAHRPMWKSATSQLAAWKDAAGGNANSVGYQAITGAFTGRIAAAGGVAPPDGSAEKDGMDILFTTLAIEGYTPAAMYWWGLDAAYADAARAAVLLNMMGTSFGLTEHNYSSTGSYAGGPNWTGVGPMAGYTGAGPSADPTTSFYLSGGPSVMAGDGGMSLNSVFAVWNTLTQPSTTNNPDWSSVNGYLQGKFRHDSGGGWAANQGVRSVYSAGSGVSPALRGFVRYSGNDTRGFAADRRDTKDTSNLSTAEGDNIEFFRGLNQGALGSTDRSLNFFLCGPAPSDDLRAARIIRSIRRGLKKAGKLVA